MHPNPIEPILSGFEKLQVEYFIAMRKLMDQKPFLTNVDVRITPFAKCFHVIQSTSISMVLFDKYVSEDSWWAAYYPSMSKEQSRIAAIDYDRFHRLAFLHLFHFAIDSSIRTFSRVLKEDATKSGTAESVGVYGFVLKQLHLSKYRGLLCIITLLRNVAHNNGRHTESTRTLSFKGKPFVFEKDKEPVLYDWLRFIEIAQEIKNLFVDIANSGKLDQSPIIDPNAQAMKDYYEKLFQGRANYSTD